MKPLRPMKNRLHDALLSVALLAFAFVASVVVLLVVWSLLPAEPDPAASVRQAGFRMAAFIVAELVLLPVFAFCLSRGWRRWNWRWPMLVSAAVLMPITGWLTWDEALSASAAVLHQTPPSPPAASESTALLARFCDFGGTGSAVQPLLRSTPAAPLLATRTMAEWRVYVVAHGDRIRFAWKSAAAAREWIAALDQYALIGDTGSNEHSQGRLRAYRDWLGLARIHAAYASLLAVEGRSDEAIEILLPMLSVSRKLMPAARSAWRLRAATSGLQACHDAARFVLAAHPPSAIGLQRLHAAIQPALDLPTVCRGMYAARYRETEAGLLPIMAPKSAPIFARIAIIPLRLVYLPQASLNLVALRVDRLAAIASDGRGEGITQFEKSYARELRSTSFKNALGRELSAFSLGPSINYVREAWSAEDSRRALQSELRSQLGTLN